MFFMYLFIFTKIFFAYILAKYATQKARFSHFWRFFFIQRAKIILIIIIEKVYFCDGADLWEMGNPTPPDQQYTAIIVITEQLFRYTTLNKNFRGKGQLTITCRAAIGWPDISPLQLVTGHQIDVRI